REEREAIARRMDDLLAGNAVLVLPTMPGIAPLRNRPQNELTDFRERAMSLLCVAGLARLPQVSLPLASLDGCPLGLSLISRRGNDTMLLALARELEGGFGGRPPPSLSPQYRGRAREPHDNPQLFGRATPKAAPAAS